MELKINEYMDIWKRCFEEQEKYIQEVRSIKHDMQAHLLVLQYCLEDGKYEEAKKYLQTMRSKDFGESVERDINVGNSLVNEIIKEYLAKSVDKICFFYKGELPKKTIVADYDLCTIFSNLISNAVEACQKLRSTEKEIHMKISTDEENLRIIMRNPVEWIVEKNMLGNGTTKEDKASHGYGLSNVRAVVEKYNGELKYICEDHFFSVEIVL